MTKYDKPFLTYDELLERLEGHDLKTGDSETENRLSKILLESISYYDLVNGYKDCFMKCEKYQNDMSLMDLFYFRIFDMNFQNIFFKYSIYAENSFKTKLSYILSKEYGESADDYLKKENFKTKENNKSKEHLEQTLENIKEVLCNSFDEPTNHYRKNHNHVPAWILLKNVTFNDSINLFSHLRKALKLEMINRFFSHDDFTDDDYIRLFKNMITIIRKFRNRIAHNYKVITYRIESKYQLYQKNMFKINPYGLMRWKDFKKVGKDDMFAMILSLVVILDNPLLVKSFIDELNLLLNNDYSNFSTNIMEEYKKITGLPLDLDKRISQIDFDEKMEEFINRKIGKELR